ncbi:hypothetical protein QVD17_42418 [Tagetes erecta]|uniref:Integrase zinc-binding domain-containing protein n=1 Tax=Tagetes erecta TaxID=13708 RepID=A0AAD8NDH8_TARER|nr:hypothetical protein QVD17_42418 [Tagetes erecta]
MIWPGRPDHDISLMIWPGRPNHDIEGWDLFPKKKGYYISSSKPFLEDAVSQLERKPIKLRKIGRSSALREIREIRRHGHYRPTVLADYIAHAKSCDACQRDKPLPWPPGLDYSKFCPFHRYAGRTIEECHTLRDGHGRGVGQKADDFDEALPFNPNSQIHYRSSPTSESFDGHQRIDVTDDESFCEIPGGSIQAITLLPISFSMISDDQDNSRESLS